MLGACVSSRDRIGESIDVDWLERRDLLRQLDDWRMEGRIALRTGSDGYNGTLSWEQLEDDLDFRFRGPFGFGGFRIHGNLDRLRVKTTRGDEFYLHDPERSRQTFRGEWLETGDKYFEDEDGYFWHAGRSDDMLKVGGIWVSPVEVESTLMSHEAVLECAVVGLTDDADLVKPKAFVVLKDGYPGDGSQSEALVEHCVANMAAYKRPRWIEFVEELPKTATGKLQRYRLR